MRFSPYTTFAVLALVARVFAQDDSDDAQGVTCFGVNGAAYPNNTRCAGSGTCCGIEAQCTPNRLCKNPGQEENMFVRGPCAFDPYDEKKCASICVYDENEDGAAFFFPRVEVCDDGSFCCSNIADCCARGRGTFLDTRGNIIDGPSTESTSDQSSAPTPPPTAATSGGSPIPTSEEATGGGTGGDGAGSGDDSHVVKIALGVAIPVVVLLIAFGVWFYIRRRRNASQKPQGDSHHVEAKDEMAVPPPTGTTASELDSRPNVVYEMDGGSTPHAPQQHVPPQELSSR